MIFGSQNITEKKKNLMPISGHVTINRAPIDECAFGIWSPTYVPSDRIDVLPSVVSGAVSK